MKKVAGTLKIDQAQYRELESFAKFSSDMDPVTAMAIDRGRKNNKLLVQPQYSPMSVAEQVAIIYCGVNSLMKDISVDAVPEFQRIFLDTVRTMYQDKILKPLAEGQLTDEVTGLIREVAASVSAQLK